MATHTNTHTNAIMESELSKLDLDPGIYVNYGISHPLPVLQRILPHENNATFRACFVRRCNHQKIRAKHPLR